MVRGPLRSLCFPWLLRRAQNMKFCVLHRPSSMACVDGCVLCAVAVMATVAWLGLFVVRVLLNRWVKAVRVLLSRVL